jgi:carbonic anhydrase
METPKQPPDRRVVGGRSVLAIAALVTIVSASLAAEGGAHWSYGGSTGPEKWGTLEHDYSSCAHGQIQSPIDIRDDVAHKLDLPPIDFAYKPSALKIVDNGHTIKVNYARGSFITVGTRRYELVELHFHKPSEEKINGKAYDMVAHLVHRDGAGKLAVVAVLLETGSANPLITTLWTHLPKEKNKEDVVDAVSVDAADLLPEKQAYYTFTGSLTTPPCTEGVTWFVLRNPTSISADQVARFGAIYATNARPVQPLNDRKIDESR